MNHALVAWPLVGLLFVVVISLGVLLYQARRRNGSLGEQARSLARDRADGVKRETDAATDEAVRLADDAVKRAQAKLKEARDADGDFADYIHGGGGS